MMALVNLGDCSLNIPTLKSTKFSPIANRHSKIENVPMADRMVHYEAAFEHYLRERGIPYVAVDEAKKAMFSNA